MNSEEISFIRHAVKDYYDVVCARAEELEVELPVYEWISYSNTPFSKTYVFMYNGDELRPPSGLRNELMHIEKELRYWSIVTPEEDDE